MTARSREEWESSAYFARRDAIREILDPVGNPTLYLLDAMFCDIAAELTDEQGGEQ